MCIKMYNLIVTSTCTWAQDPNPITYAHYTNAHGPRTLTLTPMHATHMHTGPGP